MAVPGPNVIKICKRCGIEYHPKSSRQQCCNKPIKVPCAVCGKLMDQICTFAAHNETCGIECQSKLIMQKREASANKLTKKCKWCGKEFHPNSVRDVYCEGHHYDTCVICGKQFEIDVRGYSDKKTCSEECRYISAQQNTDREAVMQHQKENLQAMYGEDVVNPMQIPGVVDKIKQTNKEKYGAEWYTQTQSYRDSVKQASLMKYGVNHPLSAQEVISKRNATVKEKYGVDNVFQNEDIKDKIKQVSLERYRVEHPAQSNVVKERTRKTNLDRYGVDHPMMLPEYQAKARETNFKKFGYAAPTQSHIKNIENWYKFINDPRDYIAANYLEIPRSKDIAQDLGVDVSTIDVYLSRNDATDCVRRAKSLMEEEIVAYIRKLKPNCKIDCNTRKIIDNKELDVYLPEYNFAIECNPTVTHNSSFPDPWGSGKKPINYHRRKTDKCEEHNIFLLHIFGYEWFYKKDIIESMIANTLGCSDKIYARKCKVVSMSSKQAKIFLQNNHRQGFANAAVYLGLEYFGDIVAVMTFGKMRPTIGIDETDLSDCWELVRFCNKTNTSVIGGASKLFTYFVRHYAPTRVRSFSDRAHTRGTLYQTLGFKEVRRSEANYVWVNIVDNKAYHRINAQKKNIKKFLKDDSIDVTHSETYIMESHGYARVYDSGTITWEWTK